MKAKANRGYRIERDTGQLTHLLEPRRETTLLRAASLTLGITCRLAAQLCKPPEHPDGVDLNQVATPRQATGPSATYQPSANETVRYS